MINIKEWLEANLEGVTIREVIFKKPPSTPYLVFDDDLRKRGSDSKNSIIEHDIIFELYTPTLESRSAVELMIDKMLNAMEYTKTSDYIKEENLYLSLYRFNLLEKED